MWSIRRRLLTWLLPGVLVCGAAATAAIYIQASAEVDEVFDRQLRQLAQTLRAQQDLSVGPSTSIGEIEEDDEIVSSAWDPKGTPIFGLAGVRAVPAADKRGFLTQTWNGQKWRAYVVAGNGGTVEVSQPLAVRASIVMTMVARIVLPMLVLIVVLGILVWIAVGRGLAPLVDATGVLATTESNTLQPMPIENAAREVKPFVAALNDLLNRLTQQLSRQEAFVSDAAHELRTPLAALQVQLELLEGAASPDEHRAAIAQLRRGIQRLTHLGQQLLTMARLDPSNPPQVETLDLSELAVGVIGELWLLAHSKHVDLGSVEHEKMLIQGDPEALKIMVKNIVDNAIRYTPGGGRVDINLRRHGDRVQLEVVDTGPGIPAEERERVFDRFYRGITQTASGSGLGLAIVERIADQNGAGILLQDGTGGRGLRFCVSFAAID